MLSTLTALHGPVWFGEAELTKKYTLNEKKFTPNFAFNYFTNFYFSALWHVKHDLWHVKHDLWHVKHDLRHVNMLYDM